MTFNGTEMVPEQKSLMTDRNYDWGCLSNRIVLEINLRSKCATQVPNWMLKPPLKNVTTLFFSWLCKMLLGSLSFSLFHKLTCLMRINALKQTPVNWKHISSSILDFQNNRIHLSRCTYTENFLLHQNLVIALT